jgi:hypothetical protein
MIPVDFSQIVHVLETPCATIGAFQHGGASIVHMVAKTWFFARQKVKAFPATRIAGWQAIVASVILTNHVDHVALSVQSDGTFHVCI